MRPLQTRWSDNDIYGHLNNTVHYHLFDTLLNAWLIEEGLLDPHNSENICLIVDTGCSYFAELAYPQTVTAGLRVERAGRSSITYRIALFGEGQQAAAQGHFTHVMVNRESRQPVQLPEAWQRTLEKAAPPESSSDPQ